MSPYDHRHRNHELVHVTTKVILKTLGYKIMVIRHVQRAPPVEKKVGREIKIVLREVGCLTKVHKGIMREFVNVKIQM